MKNITFWFIVLVVGLQIICSTVEARPFKFVILSDTHISELKPMNKIDLDEAVKDINGLSDIDFVLIAGDITDLGDIESFTAAKQALSKLQIPYYISTGNHDTKSGKLGSGNFKSVFGNDKFSFMHENFRFIGFPTSPVKSGKKAHITNEDIDFVRQQLKLTGKDIPVFLMTHYPMLKGDVNNWDVLKKIINKYDVKAIFNGHYHRNIVLNYNGIPGIVNRSNLRDKKKSIAGYNIYCVSDSLKVFGKMVGFTEQQWLVLPLNN